MQESEPATKCRQDLRECMALESYEYSGGEPALGNGLGRLTACIDLMQVLQLVDPLPHHNDYTDISNAHTGGSPRFTGMKIQKG